MCTYNTGLSYHYNYSDIIMVVLSKNRNRLWKLIRLLFSAARICSAKRIIFHKLSDDEKPVVYVYRLIIILIILHYANALCTYLNTSLFNRRLQLLLNKCTDMLVIGWKAFSPCRRPNQDTSVHDSSIGFSKIINKLTRYR